MVSLAEKLKRMGACEEAVKFVREAEYLGYSPAEIWKSAPPDWKCWLAELACGTLRKGCICNTRELTPEILDGLTLWLNQGWTPGHTVCK